jgi:phosphotriesterase-related protein
MPSHINTVNGPIAAGDLGWTLYHEHALVGMPGWESDTVSPAVSFSDLVDRSVARVEQMKAAGFSSYVDPVPNDLARNVELLKAVADRTGFNIIFATGLYHEHVGGAPYWHTALAVDAERGARKMSDLFIGEIENGVGTTGLKPGIIKVATAHGAISPYEEQIIRAAARASAQTGIPILTHTDGELGTEQLAIIESEGAQVGNVVVGHSDESSDTGYHESIINAGSYIGFDRFGYEYGVTDAQRIESVLAVRDRGQLDRLMISYDSVWNWAGSAFPQAMLEGLFNNVGSGFDRVPDLLRKAGLSEAELETIFVTNPRRFLSAESAS